MPENGPLARGGTDPSQEKEEQVLEREGMETELMDAEASDVGEEISDAKATRRGQPDHDP